MPTAVKQIAKTHVERRRDPEDLVYDIKSLAGSAVLGAITTGTLSGCGTALLLYSPKHTLPPDGIAYILISAGTLYTTCGVLKEIYEDYKVLKSLKRAERKERAIGELVTA